MIQLDVICEECNEAVMMGNVCYECGSRVCPRCWKEGGHSND